MLNPNTSVGAAIWGLIFIACAHLSSTVVRRAERLVETRVTDVTGLRFVSAFAQLLFYLFAFILYAHLVPALRTVGTALLAGVSIVSIVVGLAAQSTLSNLVAGLSLVLYRPIRVGDRVQLASPKGLTTATVEIVSLGYTILRDAENNAVIVPNSVMAGSVVIRLGATRGSSDSGEP